MHVIPSAPSIEGLTALVTGGSRGLGLLMARQLMRRGCDVVLLARDEAELNRAVTKLDEESGGSVRSVVCDVRDGPAVRDRVVEIADEHGSLDIVIANAGIIQVGPVEALGPDGFREAMESIFGGTLNTVFACLPHLRRSSAGGRLALIGSIGGLLAVPHLLPYSCAKAAVATLAEGLQEETAHGVTVTAVHPGLMRTGSHLHARFGGDRRREYAWFQPLAGAPLLSMNAERAAERIVSATQRRRARVVLTPAAKLGAMAHGVAPVNTMRIVSAVGRALPRNGSNGETAEGAKIASEEQPPARRLRRVLGVLNERAADRFNQREGTESSR